MNTNLSLRFLVGRFKRKTHEIDDSYVIIKGYFDVVLLEDRNIISGSKFTMKHIT
jgi:hypothetical protein